MQRPDEKKRALITATAAKLFATRPFHKVRLEDIAAEAKIGKGTLYVYFDNKEDLYFSLIYEGFAQLVDRLREQLGPPPSDPPVSANGNGHPPEGAAPAHEPLPAALALERIVDGLVVFAFQHPHFFELMRTVGVVKGHSESDWNRKREEFADLIADTIRRGNQSGELSDPHPELTALYIPGMVRSAMLFGPKGLTSDVLRDQILRVLERGIASRPAAAPDPPRDKPLGENLPALGVEA